MTYIDNNMRIIFIALLILSMTGCALSPRYIEPNRQDIATIKFMGSVPLINIYQDGVNCSSHRRWPENKFMLLSDGKNIEPNSTILKISPGLPFAFSTFRIIETKFTPLTTTTILIESKQCKQRLSINPLPFKHYVVTFDKNGCRATLSETSTSDGFDLHPPTSGEELKPVELIDNGSTFGACSGAA